MISATATTNVQDIGENYSKYYMYIIQIFSVRKLILK
jgi:hypothetical protein